MWFDQLLSGGIGRITPVGQATQFAIPSFLDFGDELAAGADGAVWFTEASSRKIGRITSAGVVTEFRLPTESGAPTGIVRGAGGAIWFLEGKSSVIGRISASGAVVRHRLSLRRGYMTALTAGPDGALWFAEKGGAIGRYAPGEQLREYPLVGHYDSSFDEVLHLTVGSNGDVWFTSLLGGMIGRISAQGRITEYPIRHPGASLSAIVGGPDGNVWFAEQLGAQGGVLGRITPAGAITEYSLHRKGGTLDGLAFDRTGALWFTEPLPGAIGCEFRHRLAPGATVRLYTWCANLCPCDSYRAAGLIPWTGMGG